MSSPPAVACYVRRAEDGTVRCETHQYAIPSDVSEPSRTELIRRHIEQARAEWYRERDFLDAVRETAKVEERVDWERLAKDPTRFMAKVVQESIEARFDYLSASYMLRFPGGDELHIAFGARDLQSVYDRILEIRDTFRKGEL